MADRAAPLEIVQLVADFHAVLYRYAFRLCGSVPDAEDLTQQVFLIAQQKLDQLREADAVGAWLFTILRNCYLKSRRQKVPLSMTAADFDVNTIPDDVPEEGVDSERLQTALNGLDDEFKLIVLLFYFEHRSYREIAELLDIPLGTVMSRLARAKGHLRRGLCEQSAEGGPRPALHESQKGPQAVRLEA